MSAAGLHSLVHFRGCGSEFITADCSIVIGIKHLKHSVEIRSSLFFCGLVCWRNGFFRIVSGRLVRIFRFGTGFSSIFGIFAERLRRLGVWGRIGLFRFIREDRGAGQTGKPECEHRNSNERMHQTLLNLGLVRSENRWEIRPWSNRLPVIGGQLNCRLIIEFRYLSIPKGRSTSVNPF